MNAAGFQERSRFQLRRLATVAGYGLTSLRGAAPRAAHRLSGGRLFAGRRHEMSQSLSLAHLLRSRKPIIGLTSFGERAYCQWYAERLHAGEGAIAELGCWLGSITIPLAIGLERNPRPNARSERIHAFDLFRWDAGMETVVRGTRLEGRFAPGDRFADAYLEELGPWRPLVDLHEADLSEAAWEGGPIEFLVVDAMKSWPLANNILSQFFAALIPGKSLVFHQDFAPLADALDPPSAIPPARQLRVGVRHPAFRRRGVRSRPTLPRAALDVAYDYTAFDDHEVDAAFEHSLLLAPPTSTPTSERRRSSCCSTSATEARARAELDRCRSEGLSFESDLRLAAGLLAERAGSAALESR